MNITRNQLKQIEQYADALFQEHGIDIEFQNLYKGTHFFDRVNDPRNQSPITLTDLKLLFHKVSLKYGDELGMEVPGTEGVLKDMKTDVNMPFILKWDSKNRELDLVPKTIMKKRRFHSKDREYKVENRIRLKPILEQMLSEIGDISKAPHSGKYYIGPHSGIIEFQFIGLKYKVDIRLPIKSGNKIAISVDFTTEQEEDNMTNQHQALKVMSYIVGSLQEWLHRYKKKYFRNDVLELVYIKFNPKSETAEIGKQNDDSTNKRDRLYRMYIKKYAESHNSSVSFHTSGGIIAKFDPYIKIEGN